MKHLVSLNQISKKYDLGEQSFTALQNIQLTFSQGEFSAIVGPSGSGKTTLLNIIGCLDKPTSGTYFFNDTEIASQTDDELAVIRSRHISFIFQNFNLLPVLNVFENVEYPLLNHTDTPESEKKDRIMHYIDKVGLSKHIEHKPQQLSGGQRQRVAIARALATKPKLILADEPTANLDHKTGESILQLMNELNQTEKVTFLFSTHDARVINMARRRVYIEDGEIQRSEGDSV
jgi:putative ABC transport system ATP-binding protein